MRKTFALLLPWVHFLPGRVKSCCSVVVEVCSLGVWGGGGSNKSKSHITGLLLQFLLGLCQTCFSWVQWADEMGTLLLNMFSASTEPNVALSRHASCCVLQIKNSKYLPWKLKIWMVPCFSSSSLETQKKQFNSLWLTGDYRECYLPWLPLPASPRQNIAACLCFLLLQWSLQHWNGGMACWGMLVKL